MITATAILFYVIGSVLIASVAHDAGIEIFLDREGVLGKSTATVWVFGSTHLFAASILWKIA